MGVGGLKYDLNRGVTSTAKRSKERERKKLNIFPRKQQRRHIEVAFIGIFQNVMSKIQQVHTLSISDSQ